MKAAIYIVKIGLLVVLLMGCSKPVSKPTSSTSEPNPPSTSVEPTTTGVPAQYQPLYAQLQEYLAEADKEIAVVSESSTYPSYYAAELLTADTNVGPGILQSGTQQMMINELNGEKLMGVKAITVEIGFSVFDQNFYMFTGQSQDEAEKTVQSWLNYYESLASTIHSQGLQMIVESNPLLTYYIDSQSSFNPGAYYKSLDFATYQQRRSQHNIIIAQQIKPDYLLLQTEPQTDAINDFRPELNNAIKDVSMIKQFVSDLENTGIRGLHTSLLLGSGAGTWQPDWQSFMAGLAAIPGLDKLDTHIYNLQPQINRPGELAIALEIADIAHTAGKRVSLSEFWFHKSTALVGLTENGDTLTDIRARDVFSFWSPLDEQFLQIIAKLAITGQFDYVSGFGHYNWFTLVDYNSLSLPPVYPATNAAQNTAADSQIINVQNQQAKQALIDKLLSNTGKAYQSVITAAGASASPSPETIPMEYSSIYVNLKTTLDQFSSYLDKQGDPKNQTIFGAELLPANCNRGEELLKPTVLPSVKLYLDRLQALGVQGVTIPIHYPLYTPEFPRFNEYVSFYKQVVNEIRSRGMKLDIESHVIFANTPFSSITWDYSNLTFDEYKVARRDLITRIINDFHPDFLNVGAEPDTEATLLGMNELLDPAKYTDYIAYLLDGLPKGETKVVAGIGSWGNLDYARDLANLNSLDGLSLHVYPIIGKSLSQMVQIANIARDNGKTVVFDECWLSKTDVLASNGVASSPEIFRRDAYSFWAPLDQEFLTLMVKFSRLYGVSYLSPFWTGFFFAYLDYSPEISGLSYTETAALEAQAESQNLRNGIFTSTGTEYKEQISENRSAVSVSCLAETVNQKRYMKCKERD